MSNRSPLGQRRSGVLSIRPFRRLWIATSLSSLGDWLSLLALSALAYSLTGTQSHAHGSVPTGNATAGSVAVGGVWITSLLPYLLFGPLAGAVADRLDRRLNMITGDVVRAVLFVVLATISRALGHVSSYFANPATGQVSLALYFNTATFVISAVTVYSL